MTASDSIVKFYRFRMPIAFLLLSLAFFGSDVGRTEEAPAQSPVMNRWSGKSGAVFLGISPVFLPKVAASDRLNLGNLPVFEAGLEFKPGNTIGFRYARGTIPSLQTYDATTFITTYTADAALALYELYSGVNLPIHDAYGKLGPVQFFVPIHVGGSLLTINASEDTYTSMSMDVAAGVGVRLYTHSLFRADVSAMYHYGIPLLGITKNTDESVVVQSPAGEAMKCSLTGFELRLGVSFIFPDAAPEEPK